MDENLWNHTSLQFVWTSGGRLFIENLGCCSWTFDPNSGRPFVRNPCRPFVRTSDRPFVQTYVGFHVSFWWNKYDYCAESLKAENPSPAWLTWVTLCLFTWSPVLEVLASRNFGLCFRDFECRQWEHDDAENWTYQNGPEKHSKSYYVRKQGDFANMISKVHSDYRRQVSCWKLQNRWPIVRGTLNTI